MDSRNMRMVVPRFGCSCAGCGEKILDRFLLHSLDGYWHTRCLRCTFCGTTLADVGTSCFTKEGMILCKEDYVRLFGSGGECHSCHQIIPASEMVMRTHSGQVYHVKCFSCSKCHRPLISGDRYNIVNGSNIICERDCMRLLKPTSNSLKPHQKRDTKSRLTSTIKV